MKLASKMAAASVFLVALVWVALVTSGSGRATRAPQGRAAGFPTAAGELLFAQPFRLAKPGVHAWERERGEYREGYLVVLRVDAYLARPRQERVPVLYIGDRIVERISFGSPGGRVVGILPANPRESIDLSSAPAFWARPGLPERMDVFARRNALTRAQAAGIQPPPTEELAAALRTGGAPIDLAGRTELVRYAARLGLTWAPEEAERLRGMLAPLVR